MLQQLLDVVGFGLCHQLPERSLFGGGVRVPVCARDTGIYIGFAIAFLVLAIVDRGRPSRMPPLWVNLVLGIGVAAMVFDGATSYLGLRPTTNEIRLLTGLLTGYAIAGWVTPILASEVWRVPGTGRLLADTRPAAVFFATLPGAYVFAWYVMPSMGRAFPIVVAGAIVFTFTVVNLVIVSLLPPFGRKAQRLRDIAPALGVALVLTALELLLSSALKAWALSALP